MVSISTELHTAVLNYLITKPYVEVYQLINELVKAEVLETKEEKED